MSFAIWHGAISLRSLRFAIIVFAVLLGPYSFASVAHAQEHQSHSSTSHHEEPERGDHSGVGHALTHVGSASGCPSFVATFAQQVTTATISYCLQFSDGDNAMRRSHFLNCDPPVPRGGVFKA